MKDDLGIVSASIREKLLRVVDKVNMTTTKQHQTQIFTTQSLRKVNDSNSENKTTNNNKGNDILQSNFKELHQFEEITASSKTR